MQRSVITRGFVDEAIPFIDQAAKRGKPFYINLWPDDVHSPFWPPVPKWGNNKRELYLSVLEAMDEQLGKLFNHIQKTPSLRDNSIVLSSKRPLHCATTRSCWCVRTTGRSLAPVWLGRFADIKRTSTKAAFARRWLLGVRVW